MIRYSSSKQFTLLFGGKLNLSNRWVKWSEIIPWDDFAVGYYKTMSDARGRPSKDAKMVTGALIIKHKLTLSDEESILQIQENPYLQYFIGFSRYKDESPFAPSLFVDIRRRMGPGVFTLFERVILDKVGSAQKTSTEPVAHKRELLVDATIAEQAIRYPTDLSLLNEASEISEHLIDELYALSQYSKKPRTYRRKARKSYLNLAKKKKPSLKLRCRCLREHLQFLQRNLKHISCLLDHLGSTPFPLKYKFQRQYWII